MDRKNAAFITDAEIELIGLPGKTKSIWFKDNNMVEGGWIHITIPAGTYGKIVKIPTPNGNNFIMI